MNKIDQNTAMLSLEKALVPKSNLIDGRSEKDQLRMLVDFATLFNFYDQDNTLHGNWSPFLLKDPVFLVASIAKTSFQKAYTLFINTCVQLQQMLHKAIDNIAISNIFNQLFEQLTTIFQTIQGWTKYMKVSSYDYNLKTYIINNVTETYSLLLWSLLDFQQALTQENIIPLVAPVNTYDFEEYDKKIWKESKGKIPYWTVLGLPTFPCDEDVDTKCFYISKITQQDVFTALQYTGKQLFSFYSNCISYADTELEQLKKVPGHFPDTLLLRTFTSLLKIYQKQFNSLATTHLNFYYRDILKQAPNKTVADTVFAACDLTKITDTFRLPKATQFAAGVDANKQAIIFETTTATSLNPAKIANAYTLTKAANNTELYLQKLAPVNVVSKDESGVVQQWELFGSQQAPKGTQQDFSFAFASPLLYLAEAKTRTITLTFTFSNSAEIPFSQPDFSFYLSTKDAWFEVPVPTDISDIIVTNQIVITLDAKAPVIAPFAKNPDGYTSDWPLCKIVFPNYSETYTDLAIATLDIQVDVVELQNFQLYNDFGALDASKPFQPLGPTPNVNQNFMIGSNEIFSKPIKDVSFEVNWNPFPADFNFTTYYQEYNNYLAHQYTTIPANPVDEKKIFKAIIAIIEDIFKSILEKQKKFFTSIISKEAAVIKTLVEAEIKTLEKLIETKIDDLEKKISADNALLKTTKDALATILSDITTVFHDIVTDAKSSGAVDPQKVSDKKEEITKKINDTKDAIIKNINDVKQTTLQQLPVKKESLFKRIGNAIGSVFKKEEKMEVLPFQYSNASFLIDFTWLQNGLWEAFTMKQDSNAVSSSTSENLFFPFGSANASIPDTRTFDFSGIEVSLDQIDPTLQQTALQFSDTSALGFFKMQFTAPSYGFGLELYPKVIGAIALYNGNLIANKSKDPLVNPPNIPFTPIVSKITGTYTAKTTYDFSKNDNTYPLECFYYTPFQNYKVYDISDGIIAKDTTLGSSPNRDTNEKPVALTALPFTASLTAQGQLFLELENVIAPAQVSFYFELARTYTEQTLEEKSVAFSYLSTSGWKTLPIIADGTNCFTCSGIITVNIPNDITMVHETIPHTNYWIAISTNNNPDWFAKSTFLKANGITLKRIINADDITTTAPQLNANVITSPVKAIPEISATVQPFPSFGGKASETTQQMNARVSTRLKTKDRLVTSDDYFNMIRLEFPEVYYSKTRYESSSKSSISYLVKRVSDATVANAFEPLISECTELEIQNYLQNRVSAFTTIAVSNFTLQYVKITASITVDSNYEITTVSKEINNGINVFLSPWITSAQAQITIDKGINTAQIASFINSFDAVIEVTNISFVVGSKDFTTGSIHYGENQAPKHEYTPVSGALLVPSLHNLTKESSITYSYHI